MLPTRFSSKITMNPSWRHSGPFHLCFQLSQLHYNNKLKIIHMNNLWLTFFLITLSSIVGLFSNSLKSTGDVGSTFKATRMIGNASNRTEELFLLCFLQLVHMYNFIKLTTGFEPAMRHSHLDYKSSPFIQFRHVSISRGGTYLNHGMELILKI